MPHLDGGSRIRTPCEQVLIGHFPHARFHLISIFFGSTILTEHITSGKYPEYAEYQRQVGKFLPLSTCGYQKPGMLVPCVPT